MALFLEMERVQFKPRAFEKAALAIEALDKPVEELWRKGGVKALREIPSVGEGISERIDELLRTGRCRELETMRRKTPVNVLELASIEGLGAQKIKLLYDALKIRTVDQLEKAARAGRIRRLAHFKGKSEENILRAIAFYREATARHPIATVLDLAHSIEARLRGLRTVQRVAIAGSVRRWKETIGDLDVLVAATRPDDAVRAFTSMPEVAHLYAKGPTKTMVRLRNGMDADLRIIPDRSFGAALLYFTGSKAHNIKLRRMAQEKHLKLSEYGLFRGRKLIAGATEEEIYAALGLDFIPPELREDTGEIEAAGNGKLPHLVEQGDLRGDLQAQTKWSDGTCSIEELAEAAKALGLEYIAITDHTRDLAMARGADEAKLRRQNREIHQLNARLRGIRILTGAEVNIRRDGSLDIADDLLDQLDVVGAAVHTWFDLPREEMTRRLIRAVENPRVDILFHPNARQLGHRAAVDADMDAVIDAAARSGTVLEINAQPDRLDLTDVQVRRAVEAGVKLCIDSDAHNSGDLRFPALYGVHMARRGWAEPGNIINTLPAEKMLATLKPRPKTAAKSRPARSRAASAARV